ncbi:MULTISPECIES: aminotransferase class III-fold pyridoxal phosphate-dependent enzyme [unclassified Bradyrhizobium]|uniref:aminotransferase class III-fold pyridoxal phosphate-dependent enzyme n=1 Tax=unclassified Bradyrhizobium TaxID=2631580 RepID=UPI001FF93CD5|nr:MULTISPECIES: aminotransferase class III-fold pyridoxal phosphate-dependent enzyme [unclassified Bradyrhizobium]MCK1420543.1 aminotransferase class III-fold pyridoxal phosphate-dependent enzyme [Bradyrhizobium sp. CW12]MCK1646771.1 aminotransferase class III-fold pyridoxal phosphate-dependent enzyme [Bradyrhizobium sp. 154]
MTQSLKELEAAHVVYGWQRQEVRAPAIFEKASRCYLWDTDGKKYLDFGSGQINVNVGYGHERVLAAIRAQMERTTYLPPTLPTEARIRLASMIANHMPGMLKYVFFTNSGSEAIENALKIARAVTRRQKVYSAWQSYHGATAGAAAISGDPRRMYVEPSLPGLGKFHYPNCYRCPFGQVAPPQCRFACLHSFRNQLVHDGPETVAAIVLEPISGTSGIYVPPQQYVQGVRELCDEYGVLLILDETMSGWARTGRWFACEHFCVSPDILVTAKGITSGYVPLGAVVLTSKVRDHFLDRAFVGGLTNEAHPLACSAGIANIEVYEEEQLAERSAALGRYLHDQLMVLHRKHPSVGDVRGKGLFACLELTQDRRSKAPLAGYRDKIRNVSEELCRRLFQLGLIVIAKWDFVFIAPPLIVTAEEIDDGIAKIDEVLSYTDELIAK